MHRLLPTVGSCVLSAWCMQVHYDYAEHAALNPPSQSA